MLALSLFATFTPRMASGGCGGSVGVGWGVGDGATVGVSTGCAGLSSIAVTFGVGMGVSSGMTVSVGVAGAAENTVTGDDRGSAGVGVEPLSQATRVSRARGIKKIIFFKCI
jgi:hypothetical protein